MLYKIINGHNGLVSTQFKDHLKYFVRNGKLLQLQTKTDYFMSSFLPHTVTQWRGLLSNVTDSQSLAVFKSRVQDMNHERFAQ